MADQRLVTRRGEGHFGIMEHFGEMLAALTGPGPGHGNLGEPQK